MDKATARALALERRGGIDTNRYGIACRTICAELTALLDEAIASHANITPDPHVCYRQEPLAIALYHAMKGEVSLDCFVSAVYERAMTACFPCMMKAPDSDGSRRQIMVFRTVSRERYERGGIPFFDNPLRSFLPDDPELAPYPPIDASLLDMVVVPLVAFDAENNRLGYGGGNYDRLLPNLRDGALVVGVAFEEQRIDAVPCEPHDCGLPRIVVA